jgi:hypothetical protein
MDPLSKPLPADEHELRRLRDLVASIKDELGKVWADLDNFARLILRQSTVNHSITGLGRCDDAPIVDAVVLRRLSDVTGYLPASERQTVSRELANVVRCCESIDDLAVLRARPFTAESDESGAIVSGLSVVMSGPLYQRAGESALRIFNAVRSLEDSIVAELNRRSAKAPGESKSEGAGAGSEGDKPPTPGDDAPPDDPLCERAQIVLQVLLTRNAVDSDSRVTTAEIVETTGGIDPVPYKPVIADLCRRGYAKTKEGRGGGVWLTEKGKERAAKL